MTINMTIATFAREALEGQLYLGFPADAHPKNIFPNAEGPQQNRRPGASSQNRSIEQNWPYNNQISVIV